jgi:glycyl-tRNA synthetase
MSLEPVSVEITYGLERIVRVMQGVRGFQDIRFHGSLTYGDVHLRGEIENCIYNFQVANIDNLRRLYDLCEAEAKNALDRGLALPAHDYVLKCSHVFNVLDARGAIGVTERARYFVRMRDLARQVAVLFVKQREEMGYPLLGKSTVPAVSLAPLPAATQPRGEGPFDLVLEIGSEELPVADLRDGLTQLQEKLAGTLADARLDYTGLRVLGTPRRLVAYMEGLAARQKDRERVAKGPAARIAFDEQGKPTKAALGFARGQGLDVSAIQVRLLEGKEYAVAVIVEPGREAAHVLAEILPGVMASLQFPLSMRWNASSVSYSRPLRWFMSLLGDAVVPFEYAGVRSGRTSRGIRSLGSPELAIPSAAEYLRTIADAGIMLDVEERQAAILAQAKALAGEVGGAVPEDADLLSEVANLVEYPLPIRGAFGSEYLRLPDDVLLAVMRKHQRYLPVVRDGKLLPYFIAVANGAGLDVDAVRYGNEEVLRARYADAAFFYDADRKQTLESFTPRLATLTFQERLGSVYDKVKRLERLAPELGQLLGLSDAELETTERAAALCKSDLATQLVVELTSLQGIIGRHYAELSGEPAEVALAIEEHYLPRSVGDRLPTGKPGLAVGLADRLDTLVGLFAVGIRPSGAADPWGLRRAALGVVQLLVGKGVALALPEALSLAAEQLPIEVSEDVLREVMSFVSKRYRGYLLESGFRYDMVDAVVAERGYDPYLVYRTLVSFNSWVEREDWSELLDTYARCVRITRDQEAIHAADQRQLTEPAARALYEAYRAAARRVNSGSSIDELFGALLELKPLIRRFFDDILVMTDDTEVRKSRLGLLQGISALTEGIVDLTVMEGF